MMTNASGVTASEHMCVVKFIPSKSNANGINFVGVCIYVKLMPNVLFLSFLNHRPGCSLRTPRNDRLFSHRGER